MGLLEHVKAIVAFGNKRKRLDEIDNHQAIIESMQLGAQIAYEHETGHRVWGGDKTQALGPTYFRRAYRMKNDTFYRLYSILKKELEKDFYNSDLKI